MSVLKVFQYRLYPTKEQQRLLTRQLEECRWLWNTLLAERKQAWNDRREMVDYYEQKAELPSLKAGERPSLSDVHSERRPLGATSTRKSCRMWRCASRKPLMPSSGG